MDVGEKERWGKSGRDKRMDRWVEWSKRVREEGDWWKVAGE
jgi:hypothetical protein